MADKLMIGSTAVTAMQFRNRRVTAVYRSDTRAQIFPFAPPLPIIDNVDPPTAQYAGGSTVTITGSYFSTTTSVKFGNVNATSFTVVNSTTVVATVPPGPVGASNVMLANVTGASNVFPFSYVNAVFAQGMDKASSAVPAVGTFKVLGFTARSGTVVSDSSLIVTGTGAATVTGSVAFGAVDYNGHDVRVFRNGTQVAISPTDDRGTIFISVNLSLVEGDVLELYATSRSNSRTGISANGTFLELVPTA